MSTTNDASSNNWRLISADDAFKLTTHKTTGFSIPGVSTEGTTGPNMGGLLANIAPDTILFDPFTFVFIVDEDYANYKALFKWMISNVKEALHVIDIDVDLVDNQQRSQGITLTFKDCRPSMLGEVTLDTTGEDPVLICTVTMKFQDMAFIE